jgi:hypothetical protein
LLQVVSFSSNDKVRLLDKSNHGLIIGGKRSGKSTLLQVLAEEYSKLSIPVIACDSTSRLTGLASKIENDQEVLSKFPVRIFSPLRNIGIPLNTSISEIGPTLLARMLDLTPTQKGVLNICFAIADDNNIFINSFDDLRIMLKHLKDNSKEYELDYGYASTRSIGAIQRKLLTYEQANLDRFFTLPSIDVKDFITYKNGLGAINLISLEKMKNHSLIYSTLIIFILSSLYNVLENSNKLKMVVLIDNASHLLSNIDKNLSDKLKVIISTLSKKGVAIYFSVDSTSEINEYINEELVNKIFLPMENYTEKQKQKIKSICKEMPINDFDSAYKNLLNLKNRQAIVSLVNEENIRDKTKVVDIKTPKSKMGSANASIIYSLPNQKDLIDKYSKINNYRLKIPKTLVKKDDNSRDFEKSVIRNTISTAARTFGRYLGNTLARNLVDMLETKIESFDE